MVMLVVYFLALIAVAAIWALDIRKAESWKGQSKTPALILLGLILSYGVALACLCVDPYYEDNGLPEFIAWPERWIWAAEFAGWFSFIVVPIVFGIASLARTLRALS